MTQNNKRKLGKYSTHRVPQSQEKQENTASKLLDRFLDMMTVESEGEREREKESGGRSEIIVESNKTGNCGEPCTLIS